MIWVIGCFLVLYRAFSVGYLYCCIVDIFRCLFILVLLRLVRGNPMICFLISKLMTLKKRASLVLLSLFFLVLDVLVLLIFFSPHVYAKFNCFKTVAVDSILCCAGFRIRCKINWNTKIHCWQLLQLSIIMFKKALELVTFLKLLHVP